ncbi:MAG: DUF2191 domain-containing protein [Thermoanaerobaculia bacterium]
MRTTLTLEEDVASALKARSSRTGESFKAVVNATLRLGLAAEASPPPPRRYRLEPASLGATVRDVDLDRALRLSDSLEDAEIARRLELRK